MSSAGARIAARLPMLLRTARVGLAKIGTAIKSATPRVVGVVRQAVRSPIGKVAIGAAAIGGGIGLGSYLALSGFGAGQSYAQYATDQALMGEPPPGPPLLPWGQDFLAQPLDTGQLAPGLTAMATATATDSPPSSPRRLCCSYCYYLSWGSY
jgi:hypothetical protein